MTELLNTVVIPKQSPSLIHIAIEDDNIEIVKILLEVRVFIWHSVAL